MRTVRTIFEAYLHFQPFNPNRDSETVVIYAEYENGSKTTFFHWDKGAQTFTPEDRRGKGKSFPGYQIDGMAHSSRTYLAATTSEGATIQ